MEAVVYEPVLRNKTAWGRFNRALERHNDQYAGRENLKKQIRYAYTLTARAIFADFLRAKKAGRVYDGWYETSNALIMLSTRYPNRTIKDHIERLIEIGFVLGKVQQIKDVPKTKSYNYFLHINPEYYSPQKKPPG